MNRYIIDITGPDHEEIAVSIQAPRLCGLMAAGLYLEIKILRRYALCLKQIRTIGRKLWPKRCLWPLRTSTITDWMTPLEERYFANQAKYEETFKRIRKNIEQLEARANQK